MSETTRQPDAEFKAYVYEQLACIGKALSSPQRLVLLNILTHGPHTVDELAKLGELSVANASRHLQILKAANLVAAQREGNFIRYSVASEAVLPFFNSVRDIALERLPGLREAMNEVARSDSRARAVLRDELLEKLRGGKVVLLDVRPASEHAEACIPGSLSVPLEELESRLDELPRGREVVAYCRGRYCLLADRAVEILRAAGFDARRTDDDVVAWRSNGLPVETRS